MECPYCHRVMKAGKMYAGYDSAPYWLEDGEKRSIGDAVTGKGLMPCERIKMQYVIAGFYCPLCRKMIVDADLQE